MAVIEYLAGVATVVLLNKVYEEVYWRRQDAEIQHWPPEDPGRVDGGLRGSALTRGTACRQIRLR